MEHMVHHTLDLLECRGITGLITQNPGNYLSSLAGLSAAHAGTQYSSRCARPEPAVVVPIKDHILQDTVGPLGSRKQYLFCKPSADFLREYILKG